MSKSEKSAYFRHVFANNFFLVNFQNFFGVLFSFFVHVNCKCAQNGSK
jgi:hypothetical protein